MGRYHSCSCECDCDDAPELDRDVKDSLLKVLVSAQNIRRAVPAWCVADADWLLADLEKIANALGVEDGETKARKSRLEAEQRNKREREKAQQEHNALLRLADVLGVQP